MDGYKDNNSKLVVVDR